MFVGYFLDICFENNLNGEHSEEVIEQSLSLYMLLICLVKAFQLEQSTSYN